jgi:hypothetical protein
LKTWCLIASQGSKKNSDLTWQENPESDWFVLAHWNREAKKRQLVAQKFFGKKRLVFRAALPTRTRRHRQADTHDLGARVT